MAIRHQQKNEKHPFESPTTPGLFVTMRNYVIELVCLNVNNKIGPRFWFDPKYWGLKYKREIRGIANLGKELDLTNILTQIALIQIIKEFNIKALIAKKTTARVVKLTNQRIIQLKEQRKLLAEKQQQKLINEKKNSIFIDTGNKTILAKIRESESNKDG